MSYQYVISVDYVPVMRQQFKTIFDKKLVTNEGFDAWLK
jgi:hypothetical protein